MSFNAANLFLQTPYNTVSAGYPGLFGYFSTDDNLVTILTDGYFPSDILTGWAGATDCVIISATDGGVLRSFDTNFNLVDPTLIAENISDITVSAAELSVNNCYLINNSSDGTYFLPDATTCKGYGLTIKKISDASVTATIDAFGGQIIDGLNDIIMTSQNSVLRLISDGSNFFII